ncbi:MAG TPA: TRAP transporter fused permease subunit [candidate division Zixibacteria bacterium]|nr:TRAP transporter fused permease subunit [candidate division Zixibacteria bacterium]
MTLPPQPQRADQPIDKQELIAEFEAEKPARTLSGRSLLAVQALGVALTLLGLWWVFQPIAKQLYLPLFLGIALPMTFLLYRGWGRTQAKRAEGAADNPGIIDWGLAVASVVPLLYIALEWQPFFRRSARPTDLDVIMGTILVLLALEAARRTVGWVVPAIVVAFLAYAYLGPLFPAPFTTDSHAWPRLIGHNVMSTAGVFGTPLDVAATYIILFTLYGAVLEFSGASRFFLDVSFAAFGQSRAGPGRTVTLAGFLLGTVSGSGVATTVTLGGVSWPILRRAGYPREEAGGVLAAAGIGALLSPPTLGAAAFLIAELLRVEYLQVLIWATLPTMLYYLGIVLAIEMDARRYRTHAVEIDTPPLRHLLLRYGYHFSSLVAIVVFLVLGLTAFRAVVLATALQFALAFLDRRAWWTPRRIWQAMAAGGMGVLSVTAIMAVAGIIAGVMTLTGIGFNLANIIVDLAGGQLFFTALLSAAAVLVLGLAVPVTASFVIAWPIIGPALQQLDVPNYAAAMFIFYYAVLSEVSPPTALSAFAASAITGGRPVKTMWLTWKYCLPAFLVPFVFVLAPAGEGLLLGGGLADIALAGGAAAIGVAGLAVATGAWMLRPAGWPERILFGAGGLMMMVIEPIFIAGGLAAMAIGLAVHLAGGGRVRKTEAT